MTGLFLWVLDSDSGEVLRIPYDQNDPSNTYCEDLLAQHGLIQVNCQWMVSEASQPAEEAPQ